MAAVSHPDFVLRSPSRWRRTPPRTFLFTCGTGPPSIRTTRQGTAPCSSLLSRPWSTAELATWLLSFVCAAAQIKDEGKLRKPEHLLQFGKGMYDKLAAAVLSARKLGLEVRHTTHVFAMRFGPSALVCLWFFAMLTSLLVWPDVLSRRTRACSRTSSSR